MHYGICVNSGGTSIIFLIFFFGGGSKEGFFFFFFFFLMGEKRANICHFYAEIVKLGLILTHLQLLWEKTGEIKYFRG